MMRALIALALAATLSGCIRFGPEAPEQLLRLTAAQPLPAGPARIVSPEDAIAVLVPIVPAELANNRVPVRTGATAVAYVKDAQWTEPPNRLFQRLLGDVIGARTGRPVVSPRQMDITPGTRLGGQLESFGIDAASREAVVTFDATLARGPAVQTRRFEARIPVAEIETQAVGVALNQAANQVANEVADWLK